MPIFPPTKACDPTESPPSISRLLNLLNLHDPTKLQRCKQQALKASNCLHYGEPHLQMFQEHKYQYLRQLLSRLENHLTFSDLFKSIRHLEPRARKSYSEDIHLHSNSFLELLVVDGCFILELFRKISNSIPFEPDDPIKTMTWIFSFLLRDLLMLENQIPFFILQSLFETTRSKSDTRFRSITTLSVYFFSHAVDRLDTVKEKLYDLEGQQHLLELICMSFIPTKYHVGRRELPCSSTNATSSFLNVKFNRGVIEMPMLTIDDFMSCLIANYVAYELSYKNCPHLFHDLHNVVQLSHQQFQGC